MRQPADPGARPRALILRVELPEAEVVDVDDGEHGRVRPGVQQRAVVPAAALAQSDPDAVDRQSRGHDHVRLLEHLGVECRSGRLGRATRRTDLEVGRALPRPVTLAEMRADAKLAGFDLLRLPRLSVMPVSSAQWSEILRLAGSKG